MLAFFGRPFNLLSLYPLWKNRLVRFRSHIVKLFFASFSHGFSSKLTEEVEYYKFQTEALQAQLRGVAA